MKVAFCSGCRRYVPLDQDETCPEGHARSCLRDVRQATPEETRRLFAVGASSRSGAVARPAAATPTESSSAQPQQPQLGDDQPRPLPIPIPSVLLPDVPLPSPPSPPSVDGPSTPFDDVFTVPTERSRSQFRYFRQGIAVVWMILLLVAIMGTIPLDETYRAVPTAVLIGGGLVIAVSYTAIVMTFGSEPSANPNSTRGLWAMAGLVSSMLGVYCALPQPAPIVSMPWVLGLGWTLYAALTVFGRPWRDGDPFGREERTAETMLRRTVTLAALGLCAIGLGAVFVVPDIIARRMPEWWEVLIVAFVIPLAASLTALQFVWARPTPNLVEFRGRLRISRVLMAVVAAITTPVIVFMVALIPITPLLRTAARTHTSLADVAQGPTLLCLIPILMMCAGFGYWALVQLTPVGQRRRREARKIEAELIAPLRARLVDPTGVSPEARAMVTSRVLLGADAPRVYVSDRPGFGGYALASAGAVPVVIVTEQLCREANPDQLVAVIVWLVLRRGLGFSDWWNERAVEMSADQATLHALYSPMAIVSALERAAANPVQDPGPAYFNFAPDPSKVEKRLAALRSVLYTGNLKLDPIDIESALPAPVAAVLEAAETERGW